MTDAAAEQAALTDVDNLPASVAWLAAGQLKQPVRKQPISLRVDAEVLEWFKASGPLYQSRMNDVLKAYVTYQQQRRGPRTGPPGKT
jgi:uncharacterized protein (DUF4415 family)